MNKEAPTVRPSASTEVNSEESSNTWYKGYKLDLPWLLSAYTFLHKFIQVEGNRNRVYVNCKICHEFKSEAAKFSKNGNVPLAEGIRIDGNLKLQRIIDHLESQVHSAASEAKKASDLWKQQSDKHPWVQTLKKHRTGVVNDLIALCMDAYNDSLLETPTARSWPARSLTTIRTKSIQAQLNDSNDWEVELDDYKPSGSTLHYRDPVIYAEMLHIIGGLEMKRIGEEFENAICIALQIDGSVDRRNQDMKFVVARFVTKDEPVVLKSRFVGAVQPEERGALGLLEATKNACEAVMLPAKLLVAVTTDGEAANTGPNAGLWKLLEDYLGHKLLTIWCFCHRSDLAMESAFATVPELKIWLSNVTGLAKYFRTSPSKLKVLQQMFPDLRAFPAYFEVRFAEHVHNLLSAIVHNLSGCIQFWRDFSTDNKTSKLDRSVAVGMLKTWDASTDSKQPIMTCLMADISLILQTVQKNLQSGQLILPDVITVKNNALRKLNLMLNDPFPGGLEEKFISRENENNDGAVNSTDSDEDSNEVKKQTRGGRQRRKTHHSFVTTGRRSWTAVRFEIVSSFINFLEARMNIEENELIKSFSLFLESKSSQDMVNNGRKLVETFFNENDLQEFASNVCDAWPLIEAIDELPTPDRGVKLAHRLRQMIPVTTGVLQKLLCALFIVSPHSMTVEKVISHYNQINSIHRLSTSDETINCRMHITLNGIGTASYDPRPAVAEFLRKKERRYREPDLTLYQQRDFVQKFFRNEKGL